MPPLSSSLSQTTAPAVIPVHGSERARSRLPSRRKVKSGKSSPEAAVPLPLISRRQELVAHMGLSALCPSPRCHQAKAQEILARLHALSPHVQDDGFVPSDCDRLSRAMRQQRAGQR